MASFDRLQWSGWATVAAIGWGALALPVHAQWARKPGMPSGSSTSHLVENFSTQDWNLSNFALTEDVARFQDMRFGLLVSFGITTRDEAELSWGTIDKAHRRMPDGDALSDGVHTPTEEWVNWAHDLKLQNFNADQWVKQAQDAGFKYIVFTAKHHEGFHFWDTRLSDFKVTNSPFGRDMLGELIAACHRAGMPVGIYYSQRDWYRPTYQPTGFGKDGKQPGPEHQKYIDYQFSAVRELLTHYGKIDIFWWDALWWGGMFNKQMWDAERLTREVRKLQPHIVMNNRVSVPGDFDTPEQRLGGFQNWRPFEAAVSLEDTWSYTGPKHKSAGEVISLLVSSATNNGNLLLSIGPRWTGDFDPDEVATLRQVGEWLTRNGASIYGTRGGPWKAHPWGGSTYRGATAYVHAHAIPREEIDMQMPKLKRIRSVRLLNCAAMGAGSDGNLDYAIKDGMLAIHVPAALQDKLDTIIEVQFYQDLSDVAPIAYQGGDHAATGSAAPSPFENESIYGHLLQAGVSVTANSQARIDIALERAEYVTGINLVAEPPGAPLQLEGSIDGKTWTLLWHSPVGEQASRWDIGVNDFNAGAETPGRLLRYFRITVQGTDPKALELRRLQIWAKEGK
jgi:alpha-L-fucosidase